MQWNQFIWVCLGLAWLGLCFHYNVIFTIDSNGTCRCTMTIFNFFSSCVQYSLSAGAHTNGVQWFICVSLALNHKCAEMFSTFSLVSNSIHWQHSELRCVCNIQRNRNLCGMFMRHSTMHFLAVTFIRRQLFLSLAFLWATRKTRVNGILKLRLKIFKSTLQSNSTKTTKCGLCYPMLHVHSIYIALPIARTFNSLFRFLPFSAD